MNVAIEIASGIVIKKIIIKAWINKYNKLLLKLLFKFINSIRIMNLIDIPIILDQIPIVAVLFTSVVNFTSVYHFWGLISCQKIVPWFRTPFRE